MLIYLSNIDLLISTLLNARLTNWISDEVVQKMIKNQLENMNKMQLDIVLLF